MAKTCGCIENCAWFIRAETASEGCWLTTIRVVFASIVTLRRRREWVEVGEERASDLLLGHPPGIYGVRVSVSPTGPNRERTSLLLLGS